MIQMVQESRTMSKKLALVAERAAASFGTNTIATQGISLKNNPKPRFAAVEKCGRLIAVCARLRLQCSRS
jgi:hypothetical protein